MGEPDRGEIVERRIWEFKGRKFPNITLFKRVVKLDLYSRDHRP